MNRLLLRSIADRVSDVRRGAVRRRDRLEPLAPLALALLAAPLAYLAIFSVFTGYDDEGYLLVSMRAFVGGGALYDEVYTQYGPFYYELVGGVFALLAADVEHDTGRLFTMGVWLLTSALAGLTLLRLTRNLLIALAGQLAVFYALFSLVTEPMHPGGLLNLLLFGLLALAVFVLPRRPQVALVGMGAVAGAAALVKINVGAYALAALAFAVVFAHPGLARLPWLRWAAGASLVLLPVALMASQLGEERVFRYALQVSLGAMAVALVVVPRGPAGGGRGVGLGAFAWLAWGASTLAVVVAAVTVARGTTARGLLEGLVTGPLRQPDVFLGPPGFENAALDWALVSVVGAAVAARLGAGLYAPRRPPSVAGALARLGAGGMILLTLVGPTGTIPLIFVDGTSATLLSTALPLAWVAALPSSRDDGRVAVRFVRVFVPVLAVANALHAYPVAGSQLAWAALLFVPVAAVCLADGWVDLRVAAAAGARGPGLTLAASGLGVALVAKLALLTLVIPLQANVAAYRANDPLRLPGAERLRLQPQQAETLRRLAGALEERCSTFYSMPGLNSLYVFTETEPPTALNTTTWMFLFDEETQQEVVDALRGRDGLCVVRNQRLVDFWRATREVPDRPLARFVGERFVRADAWDGYELLVRPE